MIINNLYSEMVMEPTLWVRETGIANDKILTS